LQGAWSSNILCDIQQKKLWIFRVVAGPSDLFVNNQTVLNKPGINRGICIVCDDSHCELVIRLVNSSDLLVYVHVLTEAQRQTACRAADAAGLYGTRIYFGHARNGKIADNIADGVVANGGSAGRIFMAFGHMVWKERAET
jgi:hypothetical protein